MILSLCKKHDLEFKNQTFPSFIKQLREKFFDLKTKRIDWQPHQRVQIVQEKKPICNYCNENLTEFEIDHIQPLANGGTNNMNNLQILCKSCHLYKTKTEIEDGSYVKLFKYRINL